MNLPNKATRAAVLRWLRDRISNEYDRARADLDESMDATDRKSAQLNGTKLASVSKATGATRANVTDPDALLAWVRTTHPTEVVEAVRASFTSKLLRDAKHYGGPVDESTGEVVPGITVHVGDPYVSVRLNDDAADVIRANWSEIVRVVPELDGAA